MLLINKNKKNKLTDGYTLIETMIAISIFLIVITMGVGSLVNVHLINKKSQNMRSILDSLSFSMEEMSRNIRTGYNYHCLIAGEDISAIEVPKSCVGSPGGYGIAFEAGDVASVTTDDQWIYYVNNGKLFRTTNGNVNDVVQMTPNEVVIDETGYNFSVIGAESTDTQQPLVVIRLAGSITQGGNVSKFSLQTAVSQRLNDI